MERKTTNCRNCGKVLNLGHDNYTAFDPVTKKQCKRNFYGGAVCSQSCDYQASIEMEGSMPGAGPARRLGGSSGAHYKRNWS